MIFNTLMGALRIKSMEERPISFSDCGMPGMKTLLVFPHRELDFEAVMLSEDGAVLSAPIESSIAVSRYFSVRGLPASAISLLACGERYDIPLCDVLDRRTHKYAIRCKQIYSKTAVFSAGMEHTLYTEGGRGRTRIIEAPSETDFSAELLRRLCVMEGLPDAVRSIAYRKAGDAYRMASTDKTLCLDSVAPLAGLLTHLGVRGEVEIICRGISFRFLLPRGGLSDLYIRDSELFPESALD